MPIQPLHIDRDRFLLPDGTRYDWHGHIHFMDFKRSLDGVDLGSLVAPWKACGSQSVTTLLMAHYIEDFIPHDYGARFFAHLKPFARALRDEHEMYWRPIVFADAQMVMPLLGDQDLFLARCAAEFQDEWNVLPSLTNEFQKNGIDPYRFARPATNNLWSRGSSVGDTAPATPGWDYKEWHPRRDWPKVLFGNDDGWYIKEGVDADGHQYDRPMPGICGEPIGFWDHDVPGRRSSDPNLAAVIGGTSVYYLRGGDFMAEESLHSDPPTPRTAECARRFFNAIRLAMGE